MKKIVFYLSDFQSGGTEWFALRLARELKSDTVTPLFLVMQKKGELNKLISSEFDTTILDGQGYCLCSLIKTLPKAMQFMRTHKPDAIISGLPLLNIGAALATQLARVSSSIIMVEHMRLSAEGSLLFRLRQLVKKSLTLWAHRKASHIVTVSKIVRDDIKKHLGEKKPHHLIYNPIIPSEIDALKEEPITHRWVKNKEAPLLISIGRLLPVKDHETLLHAFKLTLEKTPAKLIILGEGTELHNTERLIEQLDLQEHVSMPGTVHNVFPYLKAADLFVLSSTHEAFGNVIVEALASGTPIVSTDSGGPREILEDGRYGTLVPTENPKVLADAMADSLDKEHDTDLLIKHGMAFSVKTAADSYKKLLNINS